MLILLILCSAVSCLACAMVFRYGRVSGQRYGSSVPQRFHAGYVPRLGGVAMMAACTVGWFWIVVAERYLLIPNQIRVPANNALAWWAVALIAVAGGVAEDLTHRLTPRCRRRSSPRPCSPRPAPRAAPKRAERARWPSLVRSCDEPRRLGSEHPSTDRTR